MCWCIKQGVKIQLLSRMSYRLMQVENRRYRLKWEKVPQREKQHQHQQQEIGKKTARNKEQLFALAMDRKYVCISFSCYVPVLTP